MASLLPSCSPPPGRGETSPRPALEGSHTPISTKTGVFAEFIPWEQPGIILRHHRSLGWPLMLSQNAGLARAIGKLLQAVLPHMLRLLWKQG